MTPAKTGLARKLPPRPVAKQLVAAAAPKEVYGHAGDVLATSITIILNDGTVLTAKEGHATDVYLYLMDCERYCATRPGTVSPYLGPQMVRQDTNGRIIHPGTEK